MRQKKKKLWIAAVGVVGVALALADVVEIYPATISGTVSFSGDPDSFGPGTPAGPLTMTSVTVYAQPTTGGNSVSQSFTGASPLGYSLTVDGGAPGPANPGRSYRPYLYAYFAGEPSSSKRVYVYRSSPVTVQNVDPMIPDNEDVDFVYSSLRAIAAEVEVSGGAVTSLHFYADASSTSPQEQYEGLASRSFSTPVSLASTWIPMLPRSAVYVSGTAYVRSASGQNSTRSLPSKIVDLSQGPQSVRWEIDLQNTGTLEGTVHVASSAPISSALIYFSGVSNTPSQGVSGSISIPLTSTSGAVPYSIEMTPGDYDVYLRTYFSFSTHYSESKVVRRTVTAGAATVHSFDERHGTGSMPIAVSGFFSAEDLSNLTCRLRRAESGSTSRIAQVRASGDVCVLSLAEGTWRPDYVTYSLYDMSNPDLPVNVSYTKYYYTDAEHPARPVSENTDTPFNGEHLRLVTTNLYFDVKEPRDPLLPNPPPILVKSPYVSATRYVYNTEPPGQLKTYTYFSASGTSVAREVSALSLVAEPGIYTIEARATVNGTSTQFPGTTIKFAEPVETPAGEHQEVVLTPPGDDGAIISVAFQDVNVGGITTVVETPLGPEAPEGFRSHCPDFEEVDENGDPLCPTTYYDIKSTAVWNDEGQTATVCIQFKTKFNGVEGLMRLGHYNEDLSPPAWEVLPPPADPSVPAIINCLEPDSQCVCSEPTCGATDEISVYRICGETTSFSPFVVLQEDVELTNVVGGVTHIGREGPIQTWTVPASGSYRFTATGARAGRPTATPALVGGCGAEISGVFALQAGDMIEVLVGQEGGSGAKSAGGGGGTFVAKVLGDGTRAPLVVAGGGGGVRYGGTVPGRHAGLTTAGVAGSMTAGYTGSFILGGTNGLGGARAVSYGAGGGGWSGDGAADSTFGAGGRAFLAAGSDRGFGGDGKSCLGTGGVDRADGGFGGGGSGNGCYGGGGGGGYSGGGGGRVAGGGGSFNGGLRPTAFEGVCTDSGHGRVLIQLLPE